MFGRELVRHAKEFARLARNFKYERTLSGIFFPSANAHIGFSYFGQTNGGPWEHLCHNLVPDEGLVYMLDVAAAGGTQLTAWYTALYGNAYTPVASLTALTFAGTAGEYAGPTEGYDELTRVLWQNDAVDSVNTEIVNDTTPATFTIASASTLAVNGAALLSASAKGATNGVLLSAGRFTATKTFDPGDEFNLKYKVDFDAT